MLNRHKKDEWDVLKQQVEENKETMRKLMESVQANQMKQLEEKQERSSCLKFSLQSEF